jgi:hypothetical protein
VSHLTLDTGGIVVLSVKKLAAAITPPELPLDADGNWRAAEVVAGSEFPPDFRGMIERYGSGAFFQGHLTVFNPLTVEGQALIKHTLDTYRPFRDETYPLPYPLHPERPGLLPWGRDDNGGGYFWLTKGKPDRWPVVYLAHGSEGFPVLLPVNVTTLLAGIAVDRFEELARPDDPMTEELRVFTPGRSQAEVARELPSDRKGK